MAQNVVVSLFKVESEAYQAMTELKQYPGNDASFILEALLAKKENGTLVALDGFDTGKSTMDDTAVGGIVGALIGILGGPVGVLLGGSFGALIGSTVDAGDAVDDASIIERIAMKLDDGDMAIIALAGEETEAILDEKLGKFDVVIARFDAAVVAAEVEEAQEMEKEMAKIARKELRDQKKAERKEKAEAKRAKIAADFQAFKDKHKKNK